MKTSVWLHFCALLVASVTAAWFFMQFSERLSAPLHLWFCLLPIPWLIAGIKLSRRADDDQALFQIFKASCVLAVVCVGATVLFVSYVTVRASESSRPQARTEHARAPKTGAVATPSTSRAFAAAALPQSRAMAISTLEELRMLDGATDQWGVDNNKRPGDTPAPGDIMVYVKTGTRLRLSLESGRCLDALGNPFRLAPYGGVPAVSRLTIDQLSTVVPPDFWKPYNAN